MMKIKQKDCIGDKIKTGNHPWSYFNIYIYKLFYIMKQCDVS